ncbi:unnamed protein product [Peronospora belbahrii]|uniref:DNA replication checkpoint mediator MRC1 domain-containing protein n=1 Tax=Peronospora belbahrii TaxID=622444 RepID=A0AAU9KRQ1_9STRA|nr:unnamed protein product [Peronospora belbahrii]
MDRKELALETELLLQGVTQITRRTAVESVVEDVNALPISEYEAAKDALLAKLRKKKEVNWAQQQQLNQRRYGQPLAQRNDHLSPRKTRTQVLQLPVALTAATLSRRKQDMLLKLKTQAIEQCGQNMAKLFGYASYEEHMKHLNKLEKVKIAENEMKENLRQEGQGQENEHPRMLIEMSAGVAKQEGYNDLYAEIAESFTKMTDAASEKTTESDEQEIVKVVRRCNRVQNPDVSEEEDGNEADSEMDRKDGDDAKDDMEDVTGAVEVMINTRQVEQDTAAPGKEAVTVTVPLKDKAAGYRNLLLVEAIQSRKRKRLVKSRGDNFVESEAEEDEEEDVLKIGGLGDFGFGVPQVTTHESKEAEEERNALKLREDDLDHIVDDLSDDERAQEQDLEEMFRREQEDQDRQQVKEVIRNVKEGFGRNRRAFSSLYSGSGARGRFNLDELVAADGCKFEAARLGLLESDEELSENDDGNNKKMKASGNREAEEDEEAEMERLLRERFLNQPKMYMTSSESDSDNEEEEVKKENGADGDEVESDDERERQQMKIFSERARVNRRMQRMKDLQRQIALDNNEVDPTVKINAAMPNLLLEEDEDSQELMLLLNRTDVDSACSSQTTTRYSAKKKSDRPRLKLGQSKAYGDMTSASRTPSSFSRVIGQCKMFSANSAGGSAPSKGFVFTSLNADKTKDGGYEYVAPNDDEAMPAASPELRKCKGLNGVNSASKHCGARSGSKMTASNKKRKSGGLFSALSSYQCVTSTSHSQSLES